MRVSTLWLVLAVTAGGGPAQRTETENPTPVASVSIHDMLVDCAGAIAAEGRVDPLVEPSTGAREEDALWTVLALMDKEPGLFSMARR